MLLVVIAPGSRTTSMSSVPDAAPAEGTAVEGQSSRPASRPPAQNPPTPENFHLCKHYQDNQEPQNDPDNDLTAHDRYDSQNHLDQAEGPTEKQSGASGQLGPSTSTSKESPSTYAPFPNSSSFELGEWFHRQGGQKSLKDFHALVEILTKPTFSLSDIKETRWTTVFQDLGKNKDEINPATSSWVDDSGWKTTEISIEVPVHNKMAKGKGVESRVVGTLHHRSIVSILREKLANTPAWKFFHMDGHELRWKPGGSDTSTEFRVLSELYNSDAFMEAQREVRTNPLPSESEGCTHPRVVVGAMFWSDATHLSTFSQSKVWPLYMIFGNDSKYQRGKDGSESYYHVAYFDSVSANCNELVLFWHLLNWLGFIVDVRRFQGLSHGTDRWQDTRRPRCSPEQRMLPRPVGYNSRRRAPTSYSGRDSHKVQRRSNEKVLY